MASFMLIHAAKQPQENANHLPQNIDFLTMTEISQSNCARLHFLLSVPPSVSQTLNGVRWPESQRLDFIIEN